jgi:glycosyltransferase involved in cell wall biosynthesis
LSKIGISVIVFYKDTGKNLNYTLENVEKAFSALPDYLYEVIVVDDGSHALTSEIELRNSYKSVSKFIRLNESVGISGVVFEGVQYCRFDNILPLPGHNMFSIEALINVCGLAGRGNLVIGSRSNYSENRPPLKIIASKILNLIYRKLFFSEVDDIHGLILFLKKDLLRFCDPKAKHGTSVIVVTNTLADGGTLIKTRAPLNLGHKSRIDRKFADSFPQLKSIFSVLIALKKAFKVL